MKFFCSQILSQNCVASLQVPERVRGYLFEYELVEVGRHGATMRYTERVIKPFGNEYEIFKETVDQQEMFYPIEDIDDSHELWQKALGRVNAFTFEANERLRKAVSSTKPSTASDTFDLSDIDDLFKEHGKGTHMWELDFKACETGPVDYVTKKNERSSYWIHTHQLTGYSFRRFANVGGKSYDTG
jgi:hypothetical protein